MNAQLKQYPAGARVTVAQICGDKEEGVPGLLPISPRTWWNWVKNGHAPKGESLGPKTRVWPIEQVLALSRPKE